MTYYNRDNLFNYNPIQRGIQGNIGQQGVTGQRGDEWVSFSSVNYIPENTGYKNLPGLTGFTGFISFLGGALAPNGKIYAMPYNETKVLVIDPVGDTYYFPPGLTGIGIGLTMITKEQYNGGVLAPNGKIYAMPTQQNNILVIDTLGDTYNLINISSLNPNKQNYAGGVLALNGKIYGIPRHSLEVLVVDPNTDTYTFPSGLTGLTAISSDAFKYWGGVLAPNGKIYCMPYNSNNVLVIDPVGDTYYYPPGLTGFGITTYNDLWTDGVLAPNGKIYGIPENARDVIVINPINDTYSYPKGLTNITGAPGSTLNKEFVSGILAPNGKIYAFPRNAAGVLVIDPETDTYSYPLGLTGITNIPNLNDIHFGGGVLTPNGNIYAIPLNFTSIYKIKTGLPKYPPWMLDAYFNKL